MYKLVIALVLFVLLIGCGPQTTVVEVPVTSPAQIVQVTATPTPLPTVTPTPEVSIEPVHLVAEDGVELSAYLFGSEGDTAILLAHMGIADQRSWHPFARTITAQGFVALTFDFRGYGESASGSSTGRDLGHYMDAQAAVDFLQERGFSRIVCMGASMGGAACMNMALENDLVGLVVIGSPLPRQVIGKSYPQDLVRPDMPKLIIVTDNDPYVEVVSAASQLYEMSPEPKEIKVFPGNVHGTDIFETEHGDEFRDLLLNFVKDVDQNMSLSSALTPIPPTPTPFVSPYDYEELLGKFRYDSEMPLDIQEEAISERNGMQIHSISYASPKGRVPAYLVVPPGEGPFAGIIFVHWGQGNRDQFLDEALQFAELGAVSLLVDAPWNRPSFSLSAPDLYSLYIQTVLDLQRAVDLLVARSDIDTDRIGYVGHSYGATWGGVLAGIEKRIKAYVLMAGYVQVSKTDGPNIPQIDAINYIGHAAPSAVFFQFAEHDVYITKESALLFYQVASEPKFIEWYDTSHRFNAIARDDRVEWLRTQLGLE